MWVGRMFIVLFMIVAVLFAPIIARFEGLFNYLQVVLSYLMPPMAVLFSVGVLWKRGSPTGAFVSFAHPQQLIASLIGEEVKKLEDSGEKVTNNQYTEIVNSVVDEVISLIENKLLPGGLRAIELRLDTYIITSSSTIS